jgi:uncharacterized protein (DUF1330 family)
VSAFVVFDVEIRDAARYQDFMAAVKTALVAAGARFLARGGAHFAGNENFRIWGVYE